MTGIKTKAVTALGYVVGVIICACLHTVVIFIWVQAGLPQLKDAYITRPYAMFCLATTIFGAMAFAQTLWTDWIARASKLSRAIIVIASKLGRAIKIKQLTNLQRAIILVAILAPFILPEQFTALFLYRCCFEDFSLLVGVWIGCIAATLLWRRP